MRAARGSATISIATLLAFRAVVGCTSIVGFNDLQKVTARSDGDGGNADDDDDDVSDDDDDIGPPEGGTDSPTGPRCDPSKPFALPTVLTELDGDKETKRAIMTRDELEIFYLRGSSSPFELRHATRSSRTSAWSEPSTEVLSPGATELGSIVLNGLKLYYWEVGTGGTNPQNRVLVATRPSAGAAWGPGAVVAGVDRSVHAAEQDDAVYWSTIKTIDSSTNSLITRGNLQGTAIVGESLLTSTHVFPSLNDHPALPSSELVLYFASTRPGGGALGAGDVWRSSRTTKGEDFGPAVNVTELNSTTVDVPSWVSDDDCVILMDRSRHILMAQRPL